MSLIEQNGHADEESRITLYQKPRPSGSGRIPDAAIAMYFDEYTFHNTNVTWKQFLENSGHFTIVIMLFIQLKPTEGMICMLDHYSLEYRQSPAGYSTYDIVKPLVTDVILNSGH